jgi:hypothetical protein
MAELAQAAIKTIVIETPIQRQAQWVVSPETALDLKRALTLCEDLKYW